MANGTLSPSPWFTGLDDNGAPLSGGLLYTYAAGTTTPQATYSEVTLTTPNANPVVLDAAGRCALFLSPTSYKYVLKTAAGVTVRTQDNIGAVPTTSGEVDIAAIAGEALAAGTVAYLSQGDGGATAGRWYLADGDLAYASRDAEAIAMVPTAIASGETGTVRRDGRITGLSALSAGTAYYASGTAGALTATPPTYPRLVGVADTTTSLVLTSGPAFAPSAPAISASVNANALTISLTTADGAAPTTQPVRLTFRDATAATGSLTTIDVGTATTVVVPDTATLGTSNNVPFKAWVVAFNDAGTVRLGIINCVGTGSIYPLAAWGIASSTTISTGADSAQVFYSGTGVTANAYVVLGYVTYESGLATAGTWSAAPTRVQVYTPDVPLPGRVVQHVWASHSTAAPSASATLADTGLTATVTPMSAANKVLATVHQNGCRKTTNDTALRVVLFRAASNIAELATEACSTGGAGALDIGSISTALMDSPATTSATIYKTQFASTSGLATVTVQAASSVSTILLQEIAA